MFNPKRRLFRTFQKQKWIHCINRYRGGLETCPQAKTSKSGHAIFFFFRRVRATRMTQRRVDNTRVHFWTFSPVSVKALKFQNIKAQQYWYFKFKLIINSAVKRYFLWRFGLYGIWHACVEKFSCQFFSTISKANLFPVN